jgi:dTMP kinase
LDRSDSNLRGQVAKLRPWPHGRPGVLATFCGVDGSGKSTTIEGLRSYVEGHGQVAHVIKMPSTAARGLDYFREWADDHRAGEDGRVDIAALFFMLLGDRLLTVRKTVLSLLDQGGWVICDRYIYTAFAQLAAIGCADADMAALINMANLFPAPDLPFIMDVGAEEAIRRIRLRPAEKDSKASHDVFSRFVEGYRQLSDKNALNLLPTRDLSETSELVRNLAQPFLRPA